MKNTSDVIAGKSSNTVWHEATITRSRREQRNGHKGAIIWLTGLSGSGKSTLAHALEDRLFAMGCNTYVCDGDNIRHGLCGDLGFSPQDRVENIRRIGEVVKLF
ncbi:MAG: adenylyl-sulfate kinase, partial [Gammaproteobacteria bacterium]